MSKQRTTTTHIAGPPVCLGGRVIQRCVVCGEKLCDSLNCMMPEEPDGSVPQFPVWRQGDYVQTEGNRTTTTGNICNNDPVPEDVCLDLVE